MPTLRRATVADAELITRQRHQMFADNDLATEAAYSAMDANFLPWVTERLADGRYSGLFIEENGEALAAAGIFYMDFPPHFLDPQPVRASRPASTSATRTMSGSSPSTRRSSASPSMRSLGSCPTMSLRCGRRASWSALWYISTMRITRALPLLLLPFLLAAKNDPYAKVAPADQAPLKAGIDRYAKDQISRNWSDLYEIKFSGYALQGDYDDLSGKERVPSKKEFIEEMDESVANGERPVMQSFDLISITPNQQGYEVRACSKAQRESFHFKGVLKFTAYVKDGQVRFGGWNYVVLMPHSCSQKEDSE